MMKNVFKLSLIAVLLGVVSGCASYRTDSNTSFSSTQGVKNPTKIVVTETSLSDKKYTTVGTVEGEVKKLTIFHSDPTKEQVNVVLSEKAAALGADAVINVVYKSGIGMTTWGYIEAKGTAVKFAN